MEMTAKALRAKLVSVDQPTPAAGDDDRMPAFGMWRERKDMEDVAAFVRDLREGRRLVR